MSVDYDGMPVMYSKQQAEVTAEAPAWLKQQREREKDPVAFAVRKGTGDFAKGTSYAFPNKQGLSLTPTELEFLLPKNTIYEVTDPNTFKIIKSFKKGGKTNPYLKKYHESIS